MNSVLPVKTVDRPKRRYAIRLLVAWVVLNSIPLFVFDEAFGVVSPTKFTNVVLRRGDERRYRTPGGAGFGEPSERPRALLDDDVLEGYVTPDAARRDYGASA